MALTAGLGAPPLLLEEAAAAGGLGLESTMDENEEEEAGEGVPVSTTVLRDEDPEKRPGSCSGGGTLPAK